MCFFGVASIHFYNLTHSELTAKHLTSKTQVRRFSSKYVFLSYSLKWRAVSSSNSWYGDIKHFWSDAVTSITKPQRRTWTTWSVVCRCTPGLWRSSWRRERLCTKLRGTERIASTLCFFLGGFLHSADSEASDTRNFQVCILLLITVFLYMLC